MKAMVIKAFGGPEVFEELELADPVPGPGQLLVKVHAASVNPVDYKMRASGTWAGLKFPAIIGFDAAGTVEALGPGCTSFQVGDKIFYTPVLFGAPGTYAERHVVDEAIVARKPEGLTFLEAATLPLAGCTAWDALVDRCRVKPTETVLVHAGAGGVGSLAVQIAKAAGARVLSTARAENEGLVRSLGADIVIDYTKEDFVAAALSATDGVGVDVAFDTVGGDTLARSVKATRPRGRLASVVSTSGELGGAYLKNLELHFVFLERQKHKMEALRLLVERGQLKPVVDSVMELRDVARAHERIEKGGMRGKLALRVSAEADRR